MKLQKVNNTLMPFSDKSDMIADRKDAFQRFLEVYEKCGGKVNDVTSMVIHKKFEEHNISIYEAEEAVLKAYEKEAFMCFANVIKYIRSDTQYPVIDGGTWND